MMKTITNQQVIGHRGEAFVNERANAMGFMFSRYGPLEGPNLAKLQNVANETRRALQQS